MFRVGLTILFLAAGSAHAALYKWVDENGVTRYTTTLPPESAQYDRQVITKQGRTLKKMSGARTPEEIAEEERLKAEEEARKREQKEVEKRDRALQAAYRDIKDIEYKRETRLKALDLQIKALEGTLEKARKGYKGLLAEAIKQERLGNLPSEDIKGKIRSADREQADHEARLAEAREDRVNTAQAFADDIERFKKIKGIP